jgi:chemotaxis protein MotB
VARKKKPEEHANHERWLVSYADFITLLFAFFVVMFAVSQVDNKKVGRFTQSFSQALDWSPIEGNGVGSLAVGTSTKPGKDNCAAPTAHPRGNKKLPSSLQDIRAILSKRAGEIPSLGGLKIIEVDGEIVLRMPDRLMFDIGEASIHEDGHLALATIIDALRERDVRIRVEGHTDSKPISTVKYPSNWHLSTARAVAVVASLIEQGIAPERLAAAGYGEYHPIATNDTDDGRAQNRRVDIILVSGLKDRLEPSP